MDIMEICEKDLKKEEDVNNGKDIITIHKWNIFAQRHGLPWIITYTDSRKKHLKERLKEKTFNIDLILEEINNSDYLLGKKTSWRVNFDFIINKNNYLKILEGNYRNKIIDISKDATLKFIEND